MSIPPCLAPGGPVTDDSGSAMSQEHARIRRRGWPGAALWSILVVASLILMVIGLERSFFILGYRPSPSFDEDLRVGGLYILGGSACSLVAAVCSHLRGHPHWVTACVAAPAIVLGGMSLVDLRSGLPHLLALVVLPAAVAGAIGGLMDRGYRRVR